MNARSGGTVGDLISATIATFRNRIAFELEGQSLTYDALGGRIYSFARALRSLNCSRGDGLVVLAPNSIDVFALRCATAINGMRFTPLNARSPAQAHAFILQDSDAVLAIADQEHAEILREAIELSGGSARLVILDGPGKSLSALAENESTSYLRSEACENDVDRLAYTGGTTGNPKGVMLDHRSQLTAAGLWVSNWDVPPAPRTLIATPMSHTGMSLGLHTLMRGGTAFVLPRFDPEQVLLSIEKFRTDNTLLVPAMIYALLDDPAIKRCDLSSMRLMMYGAAPMSAARLSEALDSFGPILCQAYGQTESSGMVISLRPDDHDLSHPERLKSCGRPIIGAQVKLLDDEGNETDEGELCIRGGSVMQGYWHRPDATKETLQDGWLRTGDIARRDEEGFLYLVDRKKDIIISGGYNVYSREVEAVLDAHPDVEQSAVIGLPHEQWGEAVCAFIVRRPGSDVSPEKLIKQVKDSKGGFMAPKTIEFIDTLPMTALGKPDKQALRKPFWASQERNVN